MSLMGLSLVSHNVSFLLSSVISIVDGTVSFVISLLCPVNCSYLNLLSLLFVSPILLSSLPQENGGWGGRE